MSKRQNHVYQVQHGFFSWRGVAKSVGSAMHKARCVFSRQTKRKPKFRRYKQPVSNESGGWDGVVISLVS